MTPEASIPSLASSTSQKKSDDDSAMRNGVSLQSTIADAEQLLESDRKDPKSSSATRPGMQDFAKMLRLTTRFKHVTIEQVERVRLMHDRFSDGARFSFNYNTMLMVASVLAGLGLASNSTATIIASMLVSPIMGPVVGIAYGTTIFDLKLVRKSLATECISLLICIVMGVLIGAITGSTELADAWPTSEMLNRGTMANFWVGIPVAFFSGLGVAVSLLDDQTASLVGVAISASLLPPAVNAGLLWVAWFFVSEDAISGNVDLNETFSSVIDDSLGPDERKDFRRLGGISLALTLANILFIWIAAIVMFRMKEVLPIKKNEFWNDLGLARKIYQKRALLDLSKEIGADRANAHRQEESKEAMDESENTPSNS